MSKRAFLIALITCALMLLTGAALWLFLDEEPLDYSALDIELGPQDPEVNGYARLRQIAKEQEISLGNEFAATLWTPPQTDTEGLEEILRKNEDVRQMIEAAFESEVFRFDQQITTDVVYSDTNIVSPYIGLIRLQCHLHLMKGEHDAALRVIAQKMRHNQRYAKLHGSLFNAIFCVGIFTFTADDIFYLLAHYDFSREALQSMIDSYMLNEPMIYACQAAMAHDFAYFQATMDEIEQDPAGIVNSIPGNDFPAFLAPWFFKPNATRNWTFTIYLDAQRQFSLPHAEQNFGELAKLGELAERRDRNQWARYLNPNHVGESVMFLLIPIIDQGAYNVIRAELKHRVAYLYLAIALYRLDHGQLPPTLDALVPDYIDAVPNDPYDGEPIRYDAERAILYSVGEDFIDQGGSQLPSEIDLLQQEGAEWRGEGPVAERDWTEPTFHIRFELEPPAFEPKPDPQTN